MKFHSDLFGWNYVWRNFAEEKGGEVLTDSGDEEGKLVSVSIPCTKTGLTVYFLPTAKHGKKPTSNTILAAYNASGKFAFSIFQEKMHHQLGKALGMQDIKVQDELFDSKFMIQGSDAETVKEIFDDVQMRELILLQPPELLHVDHLAHKNYPELELPIGASAVVYQYDGVMDKLHQLENAFAIVTGVFGQLQAVGEAGGSRVAKKAAEVQAESENTGSHKLRSPLLDR